MPVTIRWPLKAIGDIAAPGVPGIHHRLCGHLASRSGTANEKDLIGLVSPCRIQRRIDPLRKVRVGPVVRKRQPFNRQNLPPQSAQIRNTDERPLRTSAHVDEDGTRITPQAIPNLRWRHVFDVDKCPVIHLRPHTQNKQTPTTRCNPVAVATEYDGTSAKPWRDMVRSTRLILTIVRNLRSSSGFLHVYARRLILWTIAYPAAIHWLLTKH